MSDKIFVGRVTTEEMTSASGPWTKTKISFNVEDMTKLKDHMNENGYVNLNFNRSMKGKDYIEIDTWQPTQQPEQAAPPEAVAPPVGFAMGRGTVSITPPPMTAGGELDDTVPFNKLGDFEQ